eukprot:463233_1
MSMITDLEQQSINTNNNNNNNSNQPPLQPLQPIQPQQQHEQQQEQQEQLDPIEVLQHEIISPQPSNNQRNNDMPYMNLVQVPIEVNGRIQYVTLTKAQQLQDDGHINFNDSKLVINFDESKDSNPLDELVINNISRINGAASVKSNRKRPRPFSPNNNNNNNNNNSNLAVKRPRIDNTNISFFNNINNNNNNNN